MLIWVFREHQREERYIRLYRTYITRWIKSMTSENLPGTHSPRIAWFEPEPQRSLQIAVRALSHMTTN
ncbi:hypothetical protein RRG08_038105 [Elysia crispata]|uniref:Uncharacterized protein n=1 Tax=Elysia crispata TaxID=231223 RepID=A0AAE0ZYY1_9GAST|nr:hypothetical protein RRG08_038105 [Elysia crispata]